MERCREIDPLERERLIQLQERERQENAEQAVSKHFEKSLRHAQEKVNIFFLFIL